MTEHAEFDRANVLFEAGRLSQSAAACRTYLGKHPNDPVAVRLYARIAEGMGLSSEAIVVYWNSVPMMLPPLTRLPGTFTKMAISRRP